MPQFSERTPRSAGYGLLLHGIEEIEINAVDADPFR